MPDTRERALRAWRTLMPAMALCVAACNAQPQGTSGHAHAAASATPRSAPAPGTTSQPALTATPGDFGTTPEGLSFSWSAGYTPPSWLPVFIRRAPPAPNGGSVVCGLDPATGLYTALIRYAPQSAAGAITVQVHGFHGAGAYANGAGATPVDVEVSPPAPNLTGLSGFGMAGATVDVAPDLSSGSLTSPLQAGSRTVGTISGDWRCA